MKDEHDKPLEALGDEALEARVVAWVLGEASPFEAAELEERCGREPELALLVRRMRELHGLIGESAAPAGPEWRLPDAKRRSVTDLLGVEPPQAVKRRRFPVRWLGMAAAACLMGLLIVGGMVTVMQSGERRSEGLAAGGVDAPSSISLEAHRDAFESRAVPQSPAPREASRARYRELASDDSPFTSGREPALAEVDDEVRHRPLSARRPAPAPRLEAPPEESPVDQLVLGGGLRSGDGAVTRESIDAVLNKPARVADKDALAQVEEKSGEMEHGFVAGGLVLDGVDATNPGAGGNAPEFGEVALKESGVETVPALERVPSLGRLFDDGESPVGGAARGVGVANGRVLDESLTGEGVVAGTLEMKQLGGRGAQVEGAALGTAVDFDGSSDRFTEHEYRESQGRIAGLDGGLTHGPGANPLWSELSDAPASGATATHLGLRLEPAPASPTGGFGRDLSLLVDRADEASGQRGWAGERSVAQPGVGDNAPDSSVSFRAGKVVTGPDGTSLYSLSTGEGGEALRRRAEVDFGVPSDDALRQPQDGFPLLDRPAVGEKTRSEDEGFNSRRNWHAFSVDGAGAERGESDARMGGMGGGGSAPAPGSAFGNSADFVPQGVVGAGRPSETETLGDVESAGREKLDAVRRGLYVGESYYALGKFEEAKQEYQRVLGEDPSNAEARRGLDRVTRAKSDYYRAAHDQTRAELLAEVDAAWEIPVPTEPGGAADRAPSELEDLVQRQQELVEDKRKALTQTIRQDKLYYDTNGDGVGREGFTSLDRARDSALRFAEVEAEKIKLESQLDTLLRYDGDVLVNYAAGLNLPENTVRELHPELLEKERELEALKVKGLAANHPEVRKKAQALEGARKELDEGVTSLRETLNAKLELAREQEERLKSTIAAEEGEAVVSSIARQSFDDARADFESAQRLLEQLKLKQVTEEMQMRITEDPVVVHEDATIEKPGFLSLDRRSSSRSVLQVRPSAAAMEVLPRMATRDPAGPNSFATEFEVVRADKTLREAIRSADLAKRLGRSEDQLVGELGKELEVDRIDGTDLLELRFKHHDGELAKDVVEAVTEAYRKRRVELENERTSLALGELRKAVQTQHERVEDTQRAMQGSVAAPPSPPAPSDALRRATLDKMAELSARDEPYSTFSLHVSDASFKLAGAAMERGEVPAPEGIRPEEFYNAFDYGDPGPTAGEPVACAVEQCAHPAFPQRNLLRIAVRTGAEGRAASTPLNLTLLLDNSGSMDREDRAEGVRNAVDSLSSLLKPGDTVTMAGFARQPRLLADRVDGGDAARLNGVVMETPSEGGTNLEEALKLAGDLAMRQFGEGAQNRVVLFTDGAANLGDADPESLNGRIEELRQQGIAFDAAGFGADGLNDRLLERLTRNGNGRYYVVDRPEEAGPGFARQLAGAFRPAAENVKVQVRFNPARVGNYKLIGFDEHRLAKEDFRNDAVDAAEMASEEAGVAVYQFEVLPDGEGEVGEVSVRFRDTASGRMVERSWTIPYDPQAPGFEGANPSLQLAGLAAFAAEKLRQAPMADAIDFREMKEVMAEVKQAYGKSGRVAELERMMGRLD